jgi:hypothetical protein
LSRLTGHNIFCSRFSSSSDAIGIDFYSPVDRVRGHCRHRRAHRPSPGNRRIPLRGMNVTEFPRTLCGQPGSGRQSSGQNCRSGWTGHCLTAPWFSGESSMRFTKVAARRATGSIRLIAAREEQREMPQAAGSFPARRSSATNVRCTSIPAEHAVGSKHTPPAHVTPAPPTSPQ